MAESPDLFAEVSALRAQVNDVRASTAALLQLNGRELKADLLAYLREDEVSKAIYLLCDGQTTQSDIVAAAPRGASPATITRRLQTLVLDKHLLMLSEAIGNTKIYKDSHLATTLGIRRSLNTGR